MYMCSCHAVTDGQIRKEVEGDCPTWKELVHRTKVSTQCGTCARDAKALFDELKRKRNEQAREKPL
jgi:bacterioferritin-associated ferredoxin